MRDELLPYYERELKFIRQMGGEFAEKYPKVAGRLLLQPDTCHDPPVERLIDAFGLLAAMVHHKLDAAFRSIADQLPIDSSRLYLNGESAGVHTLYEFLFLNSLRVAIRAIPARDGAAQAILGAGCLQQVGFTASEGILPYSDRSFLGYRLLQEYFSFPEKFFFVDVKGLDRLAKSGFGAAFDILVYLKQPDQPHRLSALEQMVGADTFQLGCTPMVNLFERTAEPIRITQTKTEYHIIPDQHRQASTEVYSVDRVSSGNYLEEAQIYEPFYCLRHGADEARKHFWYTHR